ncbi:conjugal transfer protein TraG [Sesbania bispinosa]|nr:conjugal transfer protein TraG [Sesbania bispinosa]
MVKSGNSSAIGPTGQHATGSPTTMQQPIALENGCPANSLNMKTTMNVEILRPNHLRIIDDYDDPPDDHASPIDEDGLNTTSTMATSSNTSLKDGTCVDDVELGTHNMNLDAGPNMEMGY